jgi:hypothetical protein
MKDFSFHPFLLLRTPTYSYSEYYKKDLSKLLQEPLFKAALFLASPEFYSHLKKLDFVYDNLTERAKHTVNKYFNRMSHRPTPFGLFASFTCCTWQSIEHSGVACLDKGNLYLYQDFVKITALAKKIELDKLTEVIFFPNTTTYLTKEEYRFIQQFTKDNNEDYYVVSSVSKNQFMVGLTMYCADGKSGKEIITHLIKATGDLITANDLFIHLWNEQIIVSECQPNVTGMHLVDRIKKLNRGDGPRLKAFGRQKRKHIDFLPLNILILSAFLLITI